MENFSPTPEGPSPAEEIPAGLNPYSEQQIDPADVSFDVENDVLERVNSEAIAANLDKLTPRQQEVIRQRLGFLHTHPTGEQHEVQHTLSEVASDLGVSRERIHQLERDGLFKLRRLSREGGEAEEPDFRSFIREGVLPLNDLESRVMTARHIEGKSKVQIAAEEGMSPGQVSNRLYIAERRSLGWLRARGFID